MTCGVMLHAHNNEQLDYALIALCNALAIKRHLRVPICLVTDEGSKTWLHQTQSHLIDRAFDHIIVQSNPSPEHRRFADTRSTVRMLPWYNRDRADSYSLSPFDETLLVDADYLIMDDRLGLAWGAQHDVMINRRALTLKHADPPWREKWLSDTGIELCWATCVYFRRSPLAQMLFELVQHVRDYYQYYQLVYGYPARLYRNDFAFSVAVHMLSGFTRCDAIIPPLPVPFLFSSFDHDELIDVPARDSLTFLVNDSKEQWRFAVTRTDGLSVHVMNKFSIVRQAQKLIGWYR